MRKLGLISLEERLERLHALDLSQIRRKLTQPMPEGRGWSEAKAKEAEKWYKRFLHQAILGIEAVPDIIIDEFWHQHILDTRKYREDCKYILGYFLDHNPYFGMNGDLDQRDHVFAMTQDASRQRFGEDSSSLAVMCGSTGGAPSMCGSTGSPAAMCGSTGSPAAMCGSTVLQ